MRRYIDADKIEYEDMLRPHGDGNYEECQIAYRDQIYDIPTADVRENVRGEWIEIMDADEFGPYPCGVRCSECGIRYIFCSVNLDNFCPNCGADMRGKQYDNRRL